jgi:hypothetical protein
MCNVLHPHGCLQEYPYVIYKMCLMLSCCVLWKRVLHLIWVNAHKATRWSLTRSACHHFNFNSVYDANSSWKDLYISTKTQQLIENQEMRWVHRPDRQCGDDEDVSQQKPWRVLVGSFFTYSFLPIYLPKIISPHWCQKNMVSPFSKT